MNTDFDIAVIGAGFGGSLLAMIARRLGRSVVLLERGGHPRFAMGESSTPLANLLLEELARRYDLPRLLPLTKWGTWQKTYPEIACGLKRGFTFYHHTFGEPWAETPDRRNQLLVAASPHDGIGDTHWYRSDFDHFLVREAQAQGVEYLDRIKLEKPETRARGFVLSGVREGKALSLNARFLLDASGGRGFMYHVCGAPEESFQHLPPTEALYTHFTGVGRLEETCPLSQTPPYPVDDAAVHHIFDGGWIWVLRFNNGITSAGVATTGELAKELRLGEGVQAWDRLLERLPTVREQFAGAKLQFPFIHAPKLAFRSRTAAGPGWALLPSAAGFVDPLLSTGFPLTLLGITRLAKLIETEWASKQFNKQLLVYEHDTRSEIDSVERMVAGLYAVMNDFPLFSSLSLLYFAAATFSETARRLGRPELAGDLFLMGDQKEFDHASKRCFDSALGPLGADEKEKLKGFICNTIAPVDVAGLGDASRRNWFPADARDLFKSAGKLRATREEIFLLLVRCGFNPENSGHPSAPNEGGLV